MKKNKQNGNGNKGKLLDQSNICIEWTIRIKQ